MQPGGSATALWADEDHLDLFGGNQQGRVEDIMGDMSSLARGLLANEHISGQEAKGVFFFAGSARGQPQAYEYPTGPNEMFFTVHPADDRHLRWSSDSTNRAFVIDMLAQAGVNTVLMSFWGERGADRWAYWAPMQTSTHAHDELFTALVGRDICALPVIEDSDATFPVGGHSPAYQFRDEYVGDLSPGVAACPYLENQLEDLVRRYVLEPDDPAWPSCWAKMFDREGNARYAVMLMHVAADKLAPDEHERFAAGFDRVAKTVHDRTGVLVGFTLDVLPPVGDFDRTFFAEPARTGPPLARSGAVLGVQAFIPEIYLHSSDEAVLLDFKRRFTADWATAGLPVILDASLGYYATLWNDPDPVRYGNNDTWRNALASMRRELPVKGVYVECWNGYTEGYAVVPSSEYGDANYRWLQNL